MQISVAKAPETQIDSKTRPARACILIVQWLLRNGAEDIVEQQLRENISTTMIHVMHSKEYFFTIFIIVIKM